MRIKQVDIVGFGAYRNRQLSFESGNQLLYGENEVGKSTLYQFIQAMLFGFPNKSKKRRDYTPRDGASYGGRLWISTDMHPDVKIERFRQVNSGKPKVWIGENEVPDSKLVDILDGLTQQMFSDIYTFQQEQLSQIDRLQEDDLQEALLSLGISGSQQLLDLSKLDRKQNQLVFSRQAKVRPLNLKITEFEWLQQRIQEKENQESQVQMKHQKIHEFSKEIKNKTEALRKILEQQEVLNQQESFWDEYEEWQMLKRKVSHQKVISKEHVDSLKKFYQNYQHQEESIQKKYAELARLEEGTDSGRYLFYLDHEVEINRLDKQKIDISRAFDRVTELEEYLNQKNESQVLLEKKWGWSVKNVPAKIAEQVFTQIDELLTLESECLSNQEQLSLAKQRKIELEADITQFESQDFLRSRSSEQTLKQKRLFLYGGISSLLLGFIFLLRIPSMGALFLLIGMGLLGFHFYSSKSRREPLVEKSTNRYWQEKYNQLDVCMEQLQRLSQEINGKNQQIHQLRQILQPMFGNQTNATEWRAYLSLYEKDAITYRDILVVGEENRQELTSEKEKLALIQPLIEPFNQWLPLGNLSVMDQVQAVLSFAEEMHTMKLDRLQQPSTVLSRQINQLKAERDELFDRNKELLTQVGTQHPTELPVYLRQWQENQEMQLRYTDLSKRLSPIFPELITYEQFIETQNQVKASRKKVEIAREDMSHRKQRLQVELEQMQQDGTLDDWYQKRTQLEDDIREMAVDWASNEIHARVLTNLVGNRTDSQLPQLLNETSRYFSILTANRYQKVAILDGLLTIQNKQEVIDIYQLSTGTKDQLIMALRFAFISLNPSNVLCPVLIDDGWLHYDSERKKQLAKVFSEFGRMNQVICLSSDRDMVSYYQELQQPIYELN